MPTALITPEALLEQPGPHVDALLEAGFEVRYPQDPTFTRGELGTEKTIAQLEGIDAVLAGGERLTEPVLQELSGLRVVARCGVGYDRVDRPPLLFDGGKDDRLLSKESVAAIDSGDVSAALPLPVLETELVVNYPINEPDVAVFFKPGTVSALDKN